ncbi:thioesterase family protein [Alcaligenaceae bacterium C4P045]|nr:thioesterase family protein [Alcaligenaceae bacterium C4P045]
MTSTPKALDATPLPTIDLNVESDWIDLYGHMNAAKYVYVFDHYGYRLFDHFGIGEAYTHDTGAGVYTLEIHTTYRQELLAGEALSLRLRLLDADDKRLIVLMELFRRRDGFLAATMEQLSIHVDLNTRKVKAFPDDVRDALAAAVGAHRPVPLPDGFAPRLTMTRPAR